MSNDLPKNRESISENLQPPSTAVSQVPSSNNDSRKKEIIQRLSQNYEIQPQLANRVYALGDYDLVILCDDSGSMNIPIHGTTTTRWNECRQIIEIIVDIYAALDSNGVDVYFLNRPPMFHITDTKKVHEAFNIPPNGMTPIVPTLRAIFQGKSMDKTAKQKLLILIATDGVPTNAKGELDVGELEKVMRNERTPTTFVTFLACTDEPEALDYLNNWDLTMDNVDVIDDYRSELAQIQQKKGENVKFTYGDYLIKALIGSIDRTSMDTLDE